MREESSLGVCTADVLLTVRCCCFLLMGGGRGYLRTSERYQMKSHCHRRVTNGVTGKQLCVLLLVGWPGVGTKGNREREGGRQ
eukprot:scaffold9416_cov108-Skeletonema_dohrnii-CCMP3373.AAC.3